MSDLTALPNIGKEMAKKLNGVEINTAEKLMAIGSIEAFFRLKAKYPQVCLVHLYTLEGAIQGIEFNHLSRNKKRELKAFSDSLK